MARCMQDNIVYVAQRSAPRQLLDSRPDLALAETIMSGYLGKSFYCRQGRDVWPWKFDHKFWHLFLPLTRMPDSGGSHGDFACITDARANGLRQTRWGVPWYVEWSGGIDSTTVLVALLRNLDPADFDNVHVIMNHASVWENPDFFNDHVKPNFRYVSPDHYQSAVRGKIDHLRINGDPADMLWGAVRALAASKDGVDLSAKWKSRQSSWMQFNYALWGQPATEWLYEIMAMQIDSVPQYDIVTVADWYWWLNFNFKWLQQLVYDFGPADMDCVANYFNCITPWYAGQDYQLWSIDTGRYRLGNRFDQYKTEAKDYVFAWDNNSYYRKFKLKFESNGRDVTQSTDKFWTLSDKLVIALPPQISHHSVLGHLNPRSSC